MPSYAGIGSRSTPNDVLALMVRVGLWMGLRGYVLRSGAAGGADTAFEKGCIAADGQYEIFLPWKRFNGHSSPLCYPHTHAYEMASTFHPNWGACSTAAQHLHARNCHQILGRNLDDPVESVCCWTPDAKGSGGTGQALRIARHHNIPIYDLADPKVRTYIEDIISK